MELTCPCEENMETWHSTKMSKCNPLVNIIKQNGWHTDLFANEVGASGYCSRSVSSCLKRLGLDRRKTFQAARQLGEMCMKASFCIWVARNTKVWNEHSHIPISTNYSIPTPLMPKAKQPTVTKPSTPVKAGLDQPTQSKVIYAGLMNKRNTCYANSILQALTAIPSFWSHFASESSPVSPLLKSFMLSMSMPSQSSTAVDPSPFLRALQREMSSIRKTPFNINT
ncbi:uncharacterized protein LOC130647687 [Hydractinia symbiolongicarpus]|uniref:uncharacterized protein LOC130647687 n=1 Tax=Hydractinia symbiolongicarpus TaxID=13093 RepID=UPI00254E9D51|nr:uncharacterized protein LOC130647687 [Hydractinia symbiolongicarpus]